MKDSMLRERNSAGLRVRLRAILRAGLRAATFAALAAAVLLAIPAASQAVRVRPRGFSIRPELLCVLCSLTVSPTPSAVTFTLVQGGTANGSSSVVITTTMNGVSLLSSVNLYGYFSVANAALVDGSATPNKIPSSAVEGQMTTGSPTSFTAFTQTNTVGTAGAGLLLFTTSSLLSLGCLPVSAACRTDTLSLRISLGSLPLLPAGTYTGMLVLEAQAL